MIDDSQKTLDTKYYHSMVELFSSSRFGQIVWPISGGLRRPTSTNDYIDNEVDSTFNPADDYVN